MTFTIIYLKTLNAYVFRTLLVHLQGVHQLFLCNTLTKQNSDLLRLWKNG